MHIENLSHWSGHLNREMYLNRYGHAPSADSRADSSVAEAKLYLVISPVRIFSSIKPRLLSSALADVTPV